MIIAQNLESKNLVRNCAVCGKMLTIIVYPDKTYSSSHFFGKIKLGKKEKAEYWECDKCYNNLSE